MAGIHNAIKGSAAPILLGIKRALGVMDAESGVERFSETLQPIFDQWERFEWCHLRSEWLWARSQSVAAVVGQQSRVSAGLTAGRPALMIIDRIAITGAAATAIAATISHVTGGVAALITAGDTDITPGNLDQRFNVDPTLFTGAPPVRILQGSNAVSAIFNALETIRAGADRTAHFVSIPLIVKPGGALVCENQAVNSQIIVSFSGRVRAPYPGELV